MAQQIRISCSPGAVKLVLVLLAMALAIYIVGPPLYWQLVEGLTLVKHATSCSPCICDCPSQVLVNIPSDCGKHDPDVSLEMGKNYTDLLSEELKLQETVAEENHQHADMTLLEAKKLASQYQKEAEKCNPGLCRLSGTK